MKDIDAEIAAAGKIYGLPEREDMRGCEPCKDKMLSAMRGNIVNLNRGGEEAMKEGQREILDGVMIDDKAALPRLVHIVNTHKEGEDVRQTLISFKAAYAGPYTALIVADESTDGSCDNLDPLISDTAKCPRCGHAQSAESYHALDNPASWVFQCDECAFKLMWNADKDSIIVLRNKKRVGCGKAKEQARLHAESLYPDCDYVVLHSDGHCRWMEGSLNECVRIAHKNQVIVSPGVAPLHCPAGEQPRMCSDRENCKQWKDPKAICSIWGKKRHTKIKHSHTSWGGQIQVDALGCKVDALGKPSKAYVFRESTFWAVFLMSAKTLRDRMGGWNKLPGRWGSQEIGLALRGWFADVPVVTVRAAVAGHRYRADQRKDGKAYAPYSVRTSERRANHRYTHQLVFGPKLCRKTWKPNWKELCPSQGAQDKLLVSDLNVQGKDFRSNYKRRTDEEFQQTFCPNGWPTGLIPLEDITAVVLCYRRPVNQQKTIDAIRHAGIKTWAYLNMDSEAPDSDKAISPKDCDRIFTDTANASTWGRYCIAPLVPTKWILFCDDDVELTSAGIRGLRAGAALGIDNCGLIGAKFKPPGYNDYHKREYHKSHKIRQAVPVDMLWPKGQLIFRDTAVQIFGALNEAWQDMRDAVGTTSGDDLVSTVVQSLLNQERHDFGRFPHVVPSSGKGYSEHHKEGKSHSLTKQPGRMKKKRNTMKLWRGEKYNWRSVDEVKQAREQEESGNE